MSPQMTSIFSPEATRGAVQSELDKVEGEGRKVEAEILTTGDIEIDASVPITGGPTWIRGGTVTAFVRTKVQNLKAAVGGLRIGKKFALLFCLLIASPALAQDQDSKIIHAAIGAAMVAHAADISTTMFAKGKWGDRFHEANPIMRPFIGDPVVFAVAKMGVAVGANYLLLKIHKTKPKTALVVAVAQAGLIGYIAHRNAQQLGLR